MIKRSRAQVDRRETYEVRARNGDNCLYMVLKATINTQDLRGVEVDFTSTQSGPPWPCAGDSTHFILWRKKNEPFLMHGTALINKELTNTNLQSASWSALRCENGIVPKRPNSMILAFILQSDHSNHVQYYPSNALQ